MSVQSGAIGWNRQKKVYDLTLLSLLTLYLGIFVGVGAWRNPSATAETLLIRALGTATFLLLNVVQDDRCLFGCLGLRDLCHLAIHSQSIVGASEIAALAHNGPGTIRPVAIGQNRDRRVPTV